MDYWHNELYVVLDAFHAIRRLTETTAFTRHPWHKQFCGSLSKAIFTYDAELSSSFRRACFRGKVPSKLARKLRAEHVPRLVNEKGAIEAAIGKAIAEYTNKSHPDVGPLLTERTFAAWESLKVHIRAGCLCDPPGVVLNESGAKSFSIGGMPFQKIHVKRGSSALEGFHLHQKNWLGRQIHSRKRGLALLADGSVRFNRRRRNTRSQESAVTPPVFSAGLLASTDRQYREFIAEGESRLRGTEVTCPVRDVSDTQLYTLQLPEDNGHVDNQLSSASSRELAAHHRNDVNPAESEQDIATYMAPQAALGDTAESAEVPQQQKNKKGLLDNNGGGGQCPVNVQASKCHKERKAAHCRRCRLLGSSCRLYNRIQWCEHSDIPFDEWVVNVFPGKKLASTARTERRAAQAGKPRGRPRNDQAR